MYLAAIAKLGRELELIQVDGEGWNFEEVGFVEGRRLIANGRLRTNTPLCSNDRLVKGVMSAAFEANLRVGHATGCELWVAGHDDHPFSRYTCPSFTIVSRDYAAIGRCSVDAIMKIIDSNEKSANCEVKLFEGRLILRGSA